MVSVFENEILHEGHGRAHIGTVYKLVEGDDGAAVAGGTGAVSVGVVGGADVRAGVLAFVGIFNFCPTLILSVVRLLAERMERTLTLNSDAIFVRVSPDLTE